MTKTEQFKKHLITHAPNIRMVTYISAASKANLNDKKGVEIISSMLESGELTPKDLAESLQKHIGVF